MNWMRSLNNQLKLLNQITNKMIKEKIQFGSKFIEFNIEFKERKTLEIKITPDQHVFVKAPVDTTIEKIKEKVKKRAPWILKQQSYFLTFHPLTPAKKYISGETHLYLGRQYRLKIIDAESNIVKLKCGQVQVYSNQRENVELTKKLVLAWYKKHATKKLMEYSAPFIEKFSKYNISPKDIKIQYMPKRWGSCSPKGRILLNAELVKAPKGCIEYVIIHELCHLIHPNHTKAFFDLLIKEMPDWEKWKNRLENFLS